MRKRNVVEESAIDHVSMKRRDALFITLTALVQEEHKEMKKENLQLGVVDTTSMSWRQ